MVKINIADIRQEYTKGGLGKMNFPATRFRFSAGGYKRRLTRK